jgi:hypothetical protein
LGSIELKNKRIPYGSDPFDHTNDRINTRRGGCGLSFEDPTATCGRS